MSISSREIEMRATPCAVELRSAGSRRIGGYGAVYNRKSRPLGAFVEVIENRAFAKAEADHWAGVVSRLEHKPELLLGSVAGGSLDLRTDAKGLDYSVELPNTSAGNDTLALVTRGDIHNSSVAFQCYDDEFSYDGGDFPVRHLISVRVLDVSPTRAACVS